MGARVVVSVGHKKGVRKRIDDSTKALVGNGLRHWDLVGDRASGEVVGVHSPVDQDEPAQVVVHDCAGVLEARDSVGHLAVEGSNDIPGLGEIDGEGLGNDAKVEVACQLTSLDVESFALDGVEGGSPRRHWSVWQLSVDDGQKKE